MGALALLTFAGGVAAQTSSSAMLNSLEIQDLIKRAEPADHARLGAHFAALSDQYAADARKHTAMAQAYMAGPPRRGGSAAISGADHCKRLATLNTQSAATLKELAVHHEGLAAGKTSAVPRDAARFEGGEGARAPTEKELSALAARASTPADHGALQEYFRTQAERYTADANNHAAMAQAYRGTRIAHAAAHCDRIVKLSRDSAKEATAVAEMHKGHAGVGR